MTTRRKADQSSGGVARLGAAIGSTLRGIVAGMEISSYHLMVLVVILVGGVTASSVAYVSVKNWEMRKIDSDFARRFDQVVATLERTLDIDSAVLHTLAGLQQVRGGLRREDVSAALDPAWLRAEGVQAFGWAPRLQISASVPPTPSSGGDGSGNGVGSDGPQPFERDIRTGARESLGRRSRYFPVAFVSPAKANGSLPGFDLGSDPEYRQALHRARDTGKAAATAPLVYENGNDAEQVVVVVMPVFRGGTIPDREQQRYDLLEGYVFGVFRIDGFIRTATFGMGDIMNVAVSDAGGSGPHVGATWIFGDGFEHAGGKRAIASSREAEVDVFGRTWRLYARPQPGYVFANRTWQAEGLLVAGLQFAALLDAYLLLVFGRTARVEALVVRRTAALQRSNHELKREMINRLAAERALRVGEERIKSLFDVDDTGMGLRGLAVPSASGQACDAKSHWAAHGETDPHLSETTILAPGQADATLARVSDDLRSPVASMRVAAKILSRHDTLSADEISKFVDVILDGGERLSHLINETLDLSILEAARARRLKFDSVDVERLLGRALTIANTYAARKGIEVSAEIDTELAPAMADEDRIVQILTNLAENAVRFTHPGGRVRLAAGQHNGNYLRFSITDSGLGMTAREQATAFDGFAVEGDLVEGQRQSGSVGLAVCKEIIERHGGTIWVDSRRGVGTTFSFTLPVVGKRQAAAVTQA